jgi:uncharacterized membrane protein YoaK (UPF0700 family)
MFKHKGEGRSFSDNLKLASLLSFVAGMVNVAGFLAVQRLTTNVTGHFAFFVDEVFKLNFYQGFAYFLYIFFFFLGSFSSGFLIELIHKQKGNYVFVFPAALESFILLGVAFAGKYIILSHPDVIAFALLFAMGLQNSFVTTISNAVVRTTHLTGLFTDLGIELSQLFFFKEREQKQKLQQSIRLRLAIISFFFVGGVLGGVLYSFVQLYVLSFAAIALIIGITYDSLKLRLILLSRSYQANSK